MEVTFVMKGFLSTQFKTEIPIQGFLRGQRKLNPNSGKFRIVFTWIHESCTLNKKNTLQRLNL